MAFGSGHAEGEQPAFDRAKKAAVVAGDDKLGLSELLKEKRSKNIQHQGFAGRHRPNYWSDPHQFHSGRADGIPCYLMGMVVCASLVRKPK